MTKSLQQSAQIIAEYLSTNMLQEGEYSFRIICETHCEECNEIIHNHFDCPACGRDYAPTTTYGEIEKYNGMYEITCKSCRATFVTTDDSYYDAVWRRK